MDNGDIPTNRLPQPFRRPDYSYSNDARSPPYLYQIDSLDRRSPYYYPGSSQSYFPTSSRSPTGQSRAYSADRSSPLPRIRHIPIRIATDSSRLAQRPIPPTGGIYDDAARDPAGIYPQPSSSASYIPRRTPPREFGPSRIPMSRYHFGNQSLTDRERQVNQEESVSHLRRGSAESHLESPRQNFYSSRYQQPMSYNLRNVTPAQPRDVWPVVARYYPSPINNSNATRVTVPRNSPPSPSTAPSRELGRYGNSSTQTHFHNDQISDGFKQRDNVHERPVEPTYSAPTHHSSPSPNVKSTATYSPNVNPEHSDESKKNIVVISETDILYSSTSSDEDEVVKGCNAEGQSHETELNLIRYIELPGQTLLQSCVDVIGLHSCGFGQLRLPNELLFIETSQFGVEILF